MLSVRDLHAYYGKSHILQGVNLEVGAGEIVSLLGRNGVGRSTTCKAIMGLVEPVGEVIWKGQSLAGRRADVIARAGIGYVPEDRQVFPTLTVRQNLSWGSSSPAASAAGPSTICSTSSPPAGAPAQHRGRAVGGEQQMLTMGRTLMGDPELVIIDEPTEGLAPCWSPRWDASSTRSPVAASRYYWWNRS